MRLPLLDRLPRRNRVFALAALAYAAVLLGGAAPARVALNGLRALVGAGFGPLLNAAMAAVALAWLWHCRAVLLPPDRRRVLALAGLAAGYGAAVAALPVPEERFHLVQYGLLAWLLTEALRGRLQALALHGLCTGLVVAVGALDEGVQWLLPNRVGDWRDVAINAAAALLAQGLLAATLPPAADADIAGAEP